MPFKKLIRKPKQRKIAFRIKAKRGASNVRSTRPKFVRRLARVNRRVNPRGFKKFTRGNSTSSNSYRTKLLNTLTVPNQFDFQYADQIAVPNSSTTLGASCAYFFAGYSNAARLVEIYAVDHILKIANQINTAVASTSQLDQKYFITNVQFKQILTNQSTAQANITAYYCKWRNDIVNLESFIDPRSLLGDGFYIKGISAGGRGSTNNGLNMNDLSPFQSGKFCEEVKIYNVKKVTIKPGFSHQFKLSAFKTKLIRPGRLVTATTTGQNFLTADQNYSHMEYSKFILFKITGQPTNDAVTLANVGTTTPKIDSNTQIIYTWKYIQDITPDIYREVANFTSPATANIVTQAGGIVSVEADA